MSYSPGLPQLWYLPPSSDMMVIDSNTDITAGALDGYDYNTHPGSSELATYPNLASQQHGSSQCALALPTTSGALFPVCLQQNVQQQPIADRLPTELLETLFKHLDYGMLTKEYLSACSRVSRRWRAIALPLLFRAVRVRFHADSSTEDTEQAAVFPPTTLPRARTRAEASRNHNGAAARRSIDKGKGKTYARLHHRSATTVQGRGEPERKTLSSMHGFFTRNHQFAAYVQELQLVLVVSGNNAGETDEEGSDSPPISYPLADSDELLAALHALPRLQELKMYDVALKTPISPSEYSPIDVRKLRLQFPNRAGEAANVSHYVALFNLFGVIDELWVGSFGQNLLTPDATERAALIPAPLRARLVHIEPTNSLICTLLSEALAASITLRHLELSCVIETYKPCMNYTPQINLADQAAEDSVRSLTIMGDDISGFGLAASCVQRFRMRSHLEKALIVAAVQRSERLSTSAENALLAAANRILDHLRSPPLTASLPAVTMIHIFWNRYRERAEVLCVEAQSWRVPGARQQGIPRDALPADYTSMGKDASHLLSEIAEYVHVEKLMLLDVRFASLFIQLGGTVMGI